MTWLMNFKDLKRRTLADKLWHDKAFNIAKHRKYNGYHRGLLASMMYKFFDKNPLLVVLKTKNKQINYTNHLLETLIKEN